MDLPNRMLVVEQETQVHTSAISRIPRSAGYLRFFKPIEGSNGRNISALSVDSKVWQLLRFDQSTTSFSTIK